MMEPEKYERARSIREELESLRRLHTVRGQYVMSIIIGEFRGQASWERIFISKELTSRISSEVDKRIAELEEEFVQL